MCSSDLFVARGSVVQETGWKIVEPARSDGQREANSSGGHSKQNRSESSGAEEAVNAVTPLSSY